MSLASNLPELGSRPPARLVTLRCLDLAGARAAGKGQGAGVGDWILPARPSRLHAREGTGSRSRARLPPRRCRPRAPAALLRDRIPAVESPPRAHGRAL